MKQEKNLINKLKENKNLLELQRKFEEGLIKENELTEKEKSDLSKLYKEQIEHLYIDIKINTREIQFYKEKIKNIRKRIKKS